MAIAPLTGSAIVKDVISTLRYPLINFVIAKLISAINPLSREATVTSTIIDGANMVIPRRLLSRMARERATYVPTAIVVGDSEPSIAW